MADEIAGEARPRNGHSRGPHSSRTGSEGPSTDLQSCPTTAVMSRRSDAAPDSRPTPWRWSVRASVDRRPVTSQETPLTSRFSESICPEPAPIGIADQLLADGSDRPLRHRLSGVNGGRVSGRQFPGSEGLDSLRGRLGRGEMPTVNALPVTTSEKPEDARTNRRHRGPRDPLRCSGPAEGRASGASEPAARSRGVVCRKVVP